MDVFYTDSSPQLKAYAKADVDKRISELGKQLAEARADIKSKDEELDMFLAEQQAMGEIIERKDKLIEQMREALKLALTECRSTHCENEIRAALSAAERMGK